MTYKVLPTIFYAKDAEGAEPEAEEVVEAVEEEAEPEADVSRETAPDPDDEEEETEIDGRKAIIPKWMKPHLMMEKDYRHKTMEFGETKREFEARVAAHEEKVKADDEFAKTVRTFDKERAQYENLNSQIDHYEKRVDWARWRTENPEQALQGNLEYQDLLRQQKILGTGLNEKASAMEKRAVDAQTKAMEAYRREVALKIKDWSPAKEAALKERAVKTYGLADSDFGGIHDARAMQILHDADMYHQLLAAKSKAPAPIQGAPVPKVKTVARVDIGPSDRDDDKTWLEKRNAQVIARAKAQLSAARR